MSYRDEGEAALQRMQSLQQRVTEQHEENQELLDRLQKANAEIERLKGQPVPPPLHDQAVPRINGVILRVWLGLAVGALLPLFLAAYRSETKGVQMSLLVLPVWGALIGAYAARRRVTWRMFLVGAVSGAITFVLLVGFFGTLWRSL